MPLFQNSQDLKDFVLRSIFTKIAREDLNFTTLINFGID